jgi:hypothetical protein
MLAYKHILQKCKEALIPRDYLFCTSLLLGDARPVIAHMRFQV